MSETKKLTRKVVIGLNEQGQLEADFGLLEGEVITPRDITLYQRALKRSYFTFLRNIRFSKRLQAVEEAKKVSSPRIAQPVK